jgi:hypothetical protein
MASQDSQSAHEKLAVRNLEVQIPDRTSSIWIHLADVF